MDVAQDVFVNLMRFRDRLKHQAPSSLLYTMATNLSLNYLRKRNREDRHLSIGEDFELSVKDRSFEGIDVQDLLDRIFEEHDEKTRDIAVFHYVDRMSLEETAQEVGMSVSGIRKRLRKLRSESLSMKEA
jgi:RNA polymerase sigma-70 factor (ECF subfamily)